MARVLCPFLLALILLARPASADQAGVLGGLVISASAFDLTVVQVGISHGLCIRNNVLYGNRISITATKVSVTAFQTWAIMRVSRGGHRRAALLGALAIIATDVGMASWNLHVIQERGRP